MSILIQPTQPSAASSARLGFSLKDLPNDTQENWVAFLRNDEWSSLRMLGKAYSNVPSRLAPNPELQEKCKQIYFQQKSLSALEQRGADLDRNISAKNGQLSQQQQTLTTARKSWLGWVVSKLDTESGLVGRINRIFKWLFSSFKRAADEQGKILTTIERLEAEKMALENQKMTNSISVETAKTQIDRLIEEKSKALIVNLFGNQEAFDRIPVLDVGDQEGPTGYIDFINVSSMTAPIMRGTDKYGRMFIAILAKRDGMLAGRVLFQRYSDDALSFSDARLFSDSYLNDVKPLVILQGHFINKGIISRDSDSKNLKAYRALREMIQTGRAVFEEPSVLSYLPCNEVLFTSATAADLSTLQEQIKEQINQI